MFAVVDVGNNQFYGNSGSVIKTDKIEGDEGSLVNLNTLLVSDSGSLSSGKVAAEILEQKKDKKVMIFKKKKGTYKRKRGFRAHVTVMRIKDISLI